MPRFHDATPRIGIMSAFEPEWERLLTRLDAPQTVELNAIPLVTGRFEGRDAVLLMSGMSMVNAAMTAQLLFSHFTVERLIFSGIAGGLDPALNIGDVVVPERWAQSLEAIMGRETPGGFVKPDWLTWAPDMAGHGMILPNSVIVGHAGAPAAPRVWFDADADMLRVAATLPVTDLHDVVDGQRLHQQPSLRVGGHGVSASVFVDNAGYRDYLFKVFEARITDMESAAVAHVAFANQVPFIAFRSVSDLAGADSKGNDMATFMRLAAENSARVVSHFVRALS